MQRVQLDEKLYQEAQRRATQAGFPTVDAYVADVISHDLVDDSGETPDFDHLFTPQRLAEIDAAADEVRRGDVATAQEVREHFKQKRAAWDQKNARR